MTLLEAPAVLAAGFTAGGTNAIVGSGSLVTDLHWTVVTVGVIVAVVLIVK